MKNVHTQNHYKCPYCLKIMKYEIFRRHWNNCSEILIQKQIIRDESEKNEINQQIIDFDPVYSEQEDIPEQQIEEPKNFIETPIFRNLSKSFVHFHFKAINSKKNINCLSLCK